MKQVQNILLTVLLASTAYGQVIVSATSDTGDVLETVSVDIHLNNPAAVGGFQFDMFDTPDYLDVISVSTTDRSTGFSVDFNELGSGGTRVIMFDANNGNIDAGAGAVLNMEMVVHDNAYNSNVGINFENVIITDGSGSQYAVVGNDSGTVTVSPGYIEEPHNLVAQDGMDAQVLLTWDAPYGPIPPDVEEDFESGQIPEEWEVITAGNGWYVTEDGSSAFWPVPAHTNYAVSNDDGYGGYDTPDNNGNDYLVMPTINMSGAEAVTLNFASFFTGAYSQTAHIAVSTDGGANFDDYISISSDPSWAMTSVDLSDFGGNPNVLIAFHSNDNGSWASGWAVDDILLTFSSLSVTRDVHFELTDLGSWLITAEKQDVINTYPGGIPFDWKVDLENPITLNERPVSLDSYKIYRSTDQTNFIELDEVDGLTTSYIDENVENSSTYYYYVTAIYPDGSESNATGVVSATPVEWVEIWMDDGASLSGQVDTVDFYVNNESNLGLFYFEVMDYPDVINSLNILPTDRTSDWALEIVDQGDGSIAITGIAIMTPLYPGDGPVCRAVLYPVAEEEMTVNLTFSSGSSIQDINYIELNWTAENAVFDVGIETQYGHLTGGFSEPGGTFMTSLLLANTQPVYGIQLDIVADPPFLSGTGMVASGLHDFSTWEMTAEDMGAGVMRMIMYDNPNTMSNPIVPGISHVVDVMFDALAVEEGTEVELSMDNIAISDINSLPMYTEGISADVYIGTPPAAYTIENVTGDLEPNGTGSFEVHVQNTETIGIVSFTLADLPQSMTVTNIIGLERFDDVIIDGSYGENEDGTYSFFGFDPVTGLEAGSGPILQLDVEFDNNLYNSSIILTMPALATADGYANPIMSVFHGFGQFTGYLSADDEIELPGEFALHPNYPNPFNPETIISYDLSEAVNVRLEIYDLMGRMVNLLVNQNQNPGRYSVNWNASDFFGQKVSAGVYLYRLQVGNKSFAKKMILMK